MSVSATARFTVTVDVPVGTWNEGETFTSLREVAVREGTAKQAAKPKHSPLPEHPVQRGGAVVPVEPQAWGDVEYSGCTLPRRDCECN